MRNLSLFLFVAVISVAAEKQAPPAPGNPKPFAIPAHETYSLSNGMRVTLVPWGSLPVAAVRASLDFGNINESKDEVWLSDFTTALMKEGAAGKSGAQLAQEAAAMGGGLNAGAGLEQSVASLNCLSEFAPQAVELLSDLLRKPDFPASEVERLRGDLLRRIAVDRSQPQVLASEAFAKTVYGDHPYGRLYPAPEQIRSYTLDRIKRHYAANFGAKRTHLYVAGQFDAAAVKAAIAKSFASWAAGPEPVRLPPSLAARKSFVLIDRPKAEQSSLAIGLPIGVTPAHGDYFAFQVTDSLLGGSFASRITSNIREDKGYTYSPYSAVDSHRGSGVWYESADVTTKVTAESIREIFKEVERLRKEPPTAKELQAIKNALTGIFVLRNASPGGVIQSLILAEQYGLPGEWLNTYVQKLNAVTRADVQRMAESLLNPAKMAIIVVGDKEQIGTSLEPYAK